MKTGSLRITPLSKTLRGTHMHGGVTSNGGIKSESNFLFVKVSPPMRGSRKVLAAFSSLRLSSVSPVTAKKLFLS